MDIFTISPASAKPLWLLGIICTLLLVIFLALAFTAYSSRHSEVRLDAKKLVLAGDFWGRSIPLASLKTTEAKIINLVAEQTFSPKRRTLGTGLPGYASGWFRLHNGEKALIYLTRRDQVVYLPTLENYSLLLSLDEPETFLRRLQAAAS